MNCCYSNLIEGHNTIPRDIERALANELDNDQSRRNLQIEARAHIRVQKLIDDMHTQHALPEPASADFLQWLHTEFYRDVSDEMLMIKQGQQDYKMLPGEAERVTGLKERSARMVLADLVKDGIVNTQPPKGPILLRFTSQSIDMLFPRVFAES